MLIEPVQELELVQDVRKEVLDHRKEDASADGRKALEHLEAASSWEHPEVASWARLEAALEHRKALERLEVASSEEHRKASERRKA